MENGKIDINKLQEIVDNIKKTLLENKEKQKEFYNKYGIEYKEGYIITHKKEAKIDLEIQGWEIDVIQALLGYLSSIYMKDGIMVRVKEDVEAFIKGNKKIEDVMIEGRYIIYLSGLLDRINKCILEKKEIEYVKTEDVLSSLKDMLISSAGNINNAANNGLNPYSINGNGIIGLNGNNNNPQS